MGRLIAAVDVRLATQVILVCIAALPQIDRDRCIACIALLKIKRKLISTS